MRRLRAIRFLPGVFCLLAVFGLGKLAGMEAKAGGKPLQTPLRRLKPTRDREADKELVEALRLFRRGKLAEAEPAFERIARKAKGTQTGERAQFFLAETQYQLRCYVMARDSFERLIEDYPGTEFNPRLIGREYSLAMTWLSASGPLAQPERKLPWYSRLTGEQPIVDTQKAALELLKQVQHHDPAGPFAARAALQLTLFHLQAGDEETASLLYDQLVLNHPRDPDHAAVSKLRQFQRQAQRWRQEAAAWKRDGKPRDGDDVEPAPSLPVGTLDDWAFGGKQGFQRFRGQLDVMLTTKIHEVERTLRLTPRQRQKLRLAGHGDIARLLDLVNDARKEFELAKSDIDRLAEVQRYLRSVDLRIVSGPFESSSLFAKTLRKMAHEEGIATARVGRER
jgi:hypothetical protein